MVFYELVMTTKNTTPFKNLTELVKTVSNQIVDKGGIVRGVQNHGIRELPHRFKAKYQDQVTGMRYFDKGRFISMYYDSNPKTMREVEGILRQNNDIVLRQTHLKVRNKMWYVNIVNENKNPYIKMVAEMEKQGKLE